MTKEQLIIGAKAVFETWPEADKVLATSDGQYFMPGAENHAMNHCRKTGAVITVIERDEVFTAVESDTETIPAKKPSKK